MKVLSLFVCLFAFIAGDAQSTRNRFFTAGDQLIQYTGRIDFSTSGKPRFWNPGTYITLKFTGTYCKVLINDEMLGGNNHNYLEIVLDKQKPERIKLKSKENDLLIAEHLKDTVHDLTIVKNTEAIIGYLEFVGIYCEQLLPVQLPTRKIECIGNSITCGTGSDTSVFACGQGEWYDQHNAYMSYGPAIARALNAQYHLTAVSGIGLLHSCCHMEIIMPQVFDKVSMRENKIEWDFNKYQPDVVTVCLGQNDGFQDSIAFSSAYLDFIATIRKDYPQAQIIGLTSPMAGDSLKSQMIRYLAAIAEYEHRHGDAGIHFYIFSRRYHSGCGGHPTVKNSRKFPWNYPPM